MWTHEPVMANPQAFRSYIEESATDTGILQDRFRTATPDQGCSGLGDTNGVSDGSHEERFGESPRDANRRHLCGNRKDRSRSTRPVYRQLCCLRQPPRPISQSWCRGMRSPPPKESAWGSHRNSPRAYSVVTRSMPPCSDL